MALPNRRQFSNTRENFSNAVRGSRIDGRQLQASPSAQQAVPQQQQVQPPMLPPELQRIQAMGLSFQLKLQNDSFLQGIRQQQQQLQSAVQQRQGSYLNSIQQFFDTAPPELKRFLSSPQVMQNISMVYADSQQLQPEFAQMFDLNKQYTEYVQTNYGEEQRRLQELQQQAAPQIQQYQNQMQLFNQQNVGSLQGQTPPTVRNEYDYLPEGLTQEQFMRQVRMNMDQRARTPEEYREYFKPYYDSYLKEKATPIQAQPTASKFQLSYFPPDANYEIRGNSVYMNGRNIGNIGGGRGVNDPSLLGLPNDGSIKIPAYVFDKATYTEDKDVRTTLPPSNIDYNAQAKAAALKKASEEFKERISRPVQQPTVKPIVDPIRTPTFRPPKPTEQPLTRPSGVAPEETPDPKREVKTIAPVVKPQRNDPIVDPIREPLVAKPAVKEPTFIGHSGSNDLTGGLPALKAPGLGNKPKKQRRPSGFQQSPYKGMDTNVKGLMR